MTLKDYINKEQLTEEDYNLLLNELNNNAIDFLSECQIEKAPAKVKDFIDRNGFVNAEIADAIHSNYEKYGKYDCDKRGNYILNEKTKHYLEQKYFWFIRATELRYYEAKSNYDIEQLSFEELCKRENQNTIKDTIGNFLNKTSDCWDSYIDIVKYAVTLDYEPHFYIDLCFFFIVNLDYDYAVTCFVKSKLELSALTMRDIYNYEEGATKFFQILSSAYMNGTHGLVPDKSKGFEILENYVSCIVLHEDEIYFDYDNEGSSVEQLIGYYIKGEGTCTDFKTINYYLEIIKNHKSNYENNYRHSNYLKSSFYKKIFKELELAAEQGDSNAQFSLGSCYDYGIGTVKDVEKAFYWYEKASKQNNPKAKCPLGLCYFKGKGTEKNAKHAVTLWMESAYLDDAEIYKCLGVAFAKGNGCKKDIQQAKEYFTLAIKKGDKEASSLWNKHIDNIKSKKKRSPKKKKLMRFLALIILVLIIISLFFII